MVRASLRYPQQVWIQQKGKCKQDEEAGLVKNHHSVMMSDIGATSIAKN